ncbi:uncharacterized protein ARMOST_00034 [Armillaria ostoyae]|uniref:Uncharacterized protein n=1 Tax=Armillaria ostoyae TaxID=47428 RepID=A0A284QK03_ARMOS|nr:uncharacterized protein ARMOST_00034 [Armillaria ostoyae]
MVARIGDGAPSAITSQSDPRVEFDGLHLQVAPGHPHSRSLYFLGLLLVSGTERSREILSHVLHIGISDSQSGTQERAVVADGGLASDALVSTEYGRAYRGLVEIPDRPFVEVATGSNSG